MEDELEERVRTRFEQGASRESIRRELLEQGYNEAIVEEVIRSVDSSSRKSGLRTVLEFEKKKLVLPVFAVLLIVSAIFSMYYVRSAYADNLKSMRTSSLENYADTIAQQYFNRSINVSSPSGYDNLYAAPPGSWPLIAVYTFPYLPLVPGRPPSTPREVMDSFFRPDIFPPSDGYFVAREIPETEILYRYTSRQMYNLSRNINRSRTDWTFSQFRQRFEAIKTTGYSNPAVRDFIRRLVYLSNSSNDSEKENTAIFGGIGSNPLQISSGPLIAYGIERDAEKGLQIAKHLARGDIKELQWYHFLPSIVATFLLYYVISGLIVVGFRWGRRKLS